MSASFLCFWHTSSSTVATQTPTRTEELDLLLVSHTRGTPQPPKWSSSPYVRVHDSPLSRYTIACGEWEWRVGWGLLINIHVHTRDKKWHSGRFIGVSEGGCIMFADVAYFGTLWSDSMHFSLTIQGFDLNRVIASLNPEPGKNESAGTWWECVCVSTRTQQEVTQLFNKEKSKRNCKQGLLMMLTWSFPGLIAIGRLLKTWHLPTFPEDMLPCCLRLPLKGMLFIRQFFLARYCGCPQFFLFSFSFLEFLLPVVLSDGSFRALCQLWRPDNMIPNMVLVTETKENWQNNQ